jgi:hypothetical protein
VEAAILVDPVVGLVEVIECDRVAVDDIGLATGAEHGREVRPRDVRKPNLVEAAGQLRHAIQIGSQTDIGAGLDGAENPQRVGSDRKSVQVHSSLFGGGVDDACDMEPAGGRSEIRRNGPNHDTRRVSKREHQIVTSGRRLQRQ